MATKPSDSEGKVMDVSKPGKGKIVINSRPIAAPVVNEQAGSGDVVEQPAKEPETAPVLSPSAARKTIKPISVGDTEAPAEADKTEAAEPAAEAPETPSTPPTAPEAEQTEEVAADKPETAEPESTDNLPTPKADDSPIAPAEPATDQSGAASVDELAKAAEQKRLAAEKSKEEQERDKKVKELVKSKQYFVPINHSVRRSKRPLIAGLIILLIAASAYLLIDIGVIGSSIKLPYEIFKETESSQAADDAGGETSADTNETEDLPLRTDEGDDTPAQSTPISSAGDDERRNEIRNLQVKLENYFNDNGEYPASLKDLTPALTSDETTGPDGDAYQYTVSADLQSFVLSAKLSNGSDFTADSVNP